MSPLLASRNQVCVPQHDNSETERAKAALTPDLMQCHCFILSGPWTGWVPTHPLRVNLLSVLIQMSASGGNILTRSPEITLALPPGTAEPNMANI